MYFCPEQLFAKQHTYVEIFACKFSITINCQLSFSAAFCHSTRACATLNISPTCDSGVFLLDIPTRVPVVGNASSVYEVTCNQQRRTIQGGKQVTLCTENVVVTQIILYRMEGVLMVCCGEPTHQALLDQSSGLHCHAFGAYHLN